MSDNEKREELEEMEEIEYDVLTLVDEDDVEHEFELVDTAEFEDAVYMALVPIYDQPEELLEDSGELVIMKLMEEDGQEFLDAITDEEEYDRVSAFFTERLSDVFDFED